MEIIVVITWLAISAIPALIARSKGRDAVTWLVYGILLWPIALIHICCVSERGRRRSRRSRMLVSRSSTKRCPKCAEDVKREATVCRFCRHQFSR